MRNVFEPKSFTRAGPSRLWRRISPTQLFVGSFALLIAVGTFSFLLLPGLYTGPRLSALDALFTATSAVCVTGLIVVDTATYFTPAGQALILVLIQLGGLGIITFTTIIILALGQRLSLRTQELTAGPAEIVRDIDYRRLTRNVAIYTLAFEAVGAAILFVGFLFSFSPGAAAWHAAFHAISAFCNAGFSTFSNSLIGFASAPHILIPVMALIIIGGIGFLTMAELHLWHRGRVRSSGQARFRFSLHSRIVLVSTSVLLVVGWALFLLMEWRVAFSGFPPADRVLNGLFMSVTARTAGFNTVDYVSTGDGANLLTMLLMSVGGSPGSTAGGLKTTTVAVILLLAWSRLRGQLRTSAGGRTIPEETVQRAVGLFVLAALLTVLSLFVLTGSEIQHAAHLRVQGRFIEVLFEVVSAFNTVGLSMGITSSLSSVGKWTVILLMFVGRVGPLTVGAALARRTFRSKAHFRYAQEDVIIG